MSASLVLKLTGFILIPNPNPSLNFISSQMSGLLLSTVTAFLSAAPLRMLSSSPPRPPESPPPGAAATGAGGGGAAAAAGGGGGGAE
jgi:hypothetical protein